MHLYLYKCVLCMCSVSEQTVQNSVRVQVPFVHVCGVCTHSTSLTLPLTISLKAGLPLPSEPGQASCALSQSH